MRRLIPASDEPVDLRAAYAIDSARHVRVNFASSVDGAVTVGGRSRGLSSDADRELFHLLREMSDVVLVGAGTVRTENYGGAKEGPERTPPVAVISRSLDLDPSSRFFRDTTVRPLVITCEHAPADKRASLGELADVIVAGQDVVDVTAALDRLADRGLRRVICEGGPSLFGWLAAARTVDEVCLTVAPLLAGGQAGRIIAGVATELVDPLRLVHVLEDEDHLFLRYSTA